jgi:hypothetical protein
MFSSELAWGISEKLDNTDVQRVDSDSVFHCTALQIALTSDH